MQLFRGRRRVDPVGAASREAADETAVRTASDLPDMSVLDRMGSKVDEVRWALRWRLRRALGRGGGFRKAEDSERSRALTRRWAEHWGDVRLDWWALRDGFPDRWVRFHSLPASKRHADTPTEMNEILRRHKTVVRDLLNGLPLKSLIVIAPDYGARDLSSVWTRKTLPQAWPWRVAHVDNRDPDASPIYFWVDCVRSDQDLDHLIELAAKDVGKPFVARADLGWLYRLYDGGGDVFAPTRADRDHLKALHADWLSIDPSGQ